MTGVKSKKEDMLLMGRGNGHGKIGSSEGRCIGWTERRETDDKRVVGAIVERGKNVKMDTGIEHLNRTFTIAVKLSMPYYPAIQYFS